MSKIVEQAIVRLRELPEDLQEAAAKALIHYVDQIPSLDERDAIAFGREAYKRGDFTSIDQWRHDLGIGDR